MPAVTPAPPSVVREPRALALHDARERHCTVRLVTAYTKRFTPMRSAASCSSGGSLYVPTSSHPFPRSLEQL